MLLYNFDPTSTHFYIVKLGFTGVYIIFLILLNIDCGYSLEPHRLYHLSRNTKNIRICYLKIFLFYGCKIFNTFELACFRNENE